MPDRLKASAEERGLKPQVKAIEINIKYFSLIINSASNSVLLVCWGVYIYIRYLIDALTGEKPVSMDEVLVSERSAIFLKLRNTCENPKKQFFKVGN